MEADFIFRLRNDFYSKKNKLIMFFIENDFIEFKENNKENKKYDSYFVIKEKCVNELPIQFNEFKIFAQKSNYAIHIQDMDNYVLGYLNDIGEYWKNGTIDIDYIANSFEYPIRIVLENEVIKNYIINNKYSFIEKIATEIERRII